MVRILSLVLIILTGCSQKYQIDISELNWIIGSRKAVVNDNLIIEKWEQENDTVLIGKSYVATVEDTVLMETIQIVQTSETIYYIPTVFDQNDGKPVKFKLKSSDPEQLIFENLDHDFPQRIYYYRKGKNLNAWIEGNDKRIEFYFIAVTE